VWVAFVALSQIDAGVFIAVLLLCDRLEERFSRCQHLNFRATPLQV